PPTDLYTLSLHDALPIWFRKLHVRQAGNAPPRSALAGAHLAVRRCAGYSQSPGLATATGPHVGPPDRWALARQLSVNQTARLALDRKSTRLNSSHDQISY